MFLLISCQSPNFVMLAEAMGCVGLRCEREEDVEDVIRRAREINDRPVVIDFIVGADAQVGGWRSLARPEVRAWLEPVATAAAALTLALGAGWLNDALPIKLYPVAVNALMLALFGLSLRHPPSMIERFARLQEPDLPTHAIAYTRRVTQVWCGFFVINGTLALLTALYASTDVWALYNGLIAYLLMGALFAGEWLVRQRVRARHG